MFALFAIPIGILAGYLLGGRLEHLGDLHFRWWWLAVGGLVAQVILFAGPVATVVGPWGPPLYVASTVAVLIAVLRDVRAIPGLAVVVVGAASNLLAILANGGVMPASSAAVAALETETGPGFSNSVVVASPALAPLTDIFVLPAWLPFANVYSIGDVLIGLGIVLVIALGMRPKRAGRVVETASSEARQGEAR